VFVILRGDRKKEKNIRIFFVEDTVSSAFWKSLLGVPEIHAGP